MKIWPFGKKKPATKGKRLFGGAQFNRLTADWNASIGTSQDSEVRASLRVLRNRTRQLARDNDFVKNALRSIRNNVVGQGIGMQMQVKMQRSRNGRVLNDDLNDMIQDAWSDWCRKDSCHTGGILSFSDIERLAITSVAENGEVLIRMVMGQRFGGSAVPFALEVIEADQLMDEKNGTSDAGNMVRMGVEKDAWGRPVNYWFYPQHPGDYLFHQNQPSKYKVIDADEIVHLFITDRVGQTRGVPWFASALKRMHQVSGFEEAEVVAARASAAIMGFIQTPDGELQDDGVMDGQRVSDFAPGKIEALGPGESFVPFAPNRPGGTYDPFMRSQLRAVGAGVGVSYETLSKDYSQSNYSSSRLALIDDRDNWRVLQKWMIENFHQRIFEAWLDMAVLSGTLDLPGYEVNPTPYRQVRWMPRGWSWVDPMKEVQAYKEAVRSGFMTQADVVAAMGQDLDEMLQQRKRELDSAASMDLVFDTDPAMVDAKGSIHPAPAGSEGEEIQSGQMPAGVDDQGAAPATNDDGDDDGDDESPATSSGNL
jgi:lambda family phage portal protein